ncbi:hypothetical protein L798_01252 [Zootermopsis nevadensis]|uniref:Uncharacterized protein n=1 Tax=Zootermopsis nevadensis TaxID=136037 RepID=A0A067QTV1_ZOONE|nr:hypothetical protein L798_01252 [Zootermopsis nevadensis]
MFTNIHRPDDGGSMTSETLVNIDQTTQRNNPEDRHLHTHRPDDGGSMTSETLVNIDQTTQRSNPEDGNLHTRRSVNLKSFKLYGVLQLSMLCRVEWERDRKNYELAGV